MEIFMIRHSTPEIAKGVCYGQSDIQLASSFPDEWNLLMKKLPDSVDMIFSSPLSRCMRLSALLADHFRVATLQDARLLEMNFGDWEMKMWNDIDQLQLNHWMNNYLDVQCPNGESYQDVRKRLKNFLIDKLTSDSKTYMIVTHGGIIKCFHGILNDTNGMDYAINFGGIYHFSGTLRVADDK